MLESLAAETRSVGWRHGPQDKVTLITVAIGIVAFLIAWSIVEVLIGFAFLLIKLVLAAIIAVVIAVAGLVLYNRWRPSK